MRARYGNHHEKVLHLIVSHGYSVECFSTLNGGKKTFPDYCAISGIEIHNDNINLLFDGCTNHVKTKH